MDDLVSTDWLVENLSSADLVVLDASLHMAGVGRDARAEYEQRHIPGARFFDIEFLSDHDAASPHMLPSAENFAQGMEALGVSATDRIVVYDQSALRTSARAWFMLHHFGATQVAILDGGLAKWIAEGRPTESGQPLDRKARFDAVGRPGEVVDKQQIQRGLGIPLVDARGRPRFEGTEPDPRTGVAPGHVPGSRNIPYASVYNEDGTFKRGEALRQVFAEAGVDPERPFVASCGSGVTANSLIFAARLLGNRDARLYDGSWSEWGADPHTAKAVGPA
ncbi:3-mercaptopyruvate sulfurtransferase [Sphingomonas arenae]|uniref:3-mercaptopyruvate sulfurtransferase n=1 Tax=Sphingomonas arenae TaxID=2812555 RepID=UPI00196718C3|nr:3-mercaptopyruvate sulfurtransferase [Sphingomonas arenae]